MSNKNPKYKFDDFYEQYFDYVFNYIYLRIPSIHDTEDIASEVFTAIWQNWKNINHDINIRNYVFKIAKNKINDYLRKFYRINLHTAHVDPEEIPFEKIVVDSARSKKTESILTSICLSLNPKEKKYFSLRYEKNYTFKEISEELGITINNAKVYNNRLVKKIKKLWQN